MNARRFQNNHSSIQNLISHILVEIKLSSSRVKENGTSSKMDFYVTRFLGVSYKHVRLSEKIEVRWIPPAPGWIKANIDGSTFGDPLSASIEVIFRDGYANFKGGFVQNIGIPIAFTIELCALMFVVEITKKLNWRNIWIETDSQTMVNAFKQAYEFPWSLNNR